MKLGLAAALALLALTGCRADRTRAADKPDVYLLTSLPLLFEEGFGLEPAKGEAATFLRDHYRLKPIDLPSQLPAGGVLLATQPRALPAEELVALDAWLRGGGQLLLLADPMLEWPSERALGGQLRPPVSFSDTGLLAHWGLRLDAPDERGSTSIEVAGSKVTMISPGRLVKVGGTCRMDGDSGASATCAFGKGEARVVADADWLNVEAITRSGGSRTDNLALLNRLIATHD